LVEEFIVLEQARRGALPAEEAYLPPGFFEEK
jgi:hypothetical protein